MYASGCASEDETRNTIAHPGRHRGTAVPHSAVAVKVANAALDRARPMITLATAHPAKFPDAVEAATGHRPGLPNRMADLYRQDRAGEHVENDVSRVRISFAKGSPRDRSDAHIAQRPSGRDRIHAGSGKRRGRALDQRGRPARAGRTERHRAFPGTHGLQGHQDGATRSRSPRRSRMSGAISTPTPRARRRPITRGC